MLPGKHQVKLNDKYQSFSRAYCFICRVENKKTQKRHRGHQSHVCLLSCCGRRSHQQPWWALCFWRSCCSIPGKTNLKRTDTCRRSTSQTRAKFTRLNFGSTFHIYRCIFLHWIYSGETSRIWFIIFTQWVIHGSKKWGERRTCATVWSRKGMDHQQWRS